MLTYEKARAYIEYERLMAEIRMLRLGLTYDVKSDKLEERYTGQPRKKNGQFDFGKASGTGVNLNLQFFAKKGLKNQSVNNLKKGIRSLEIKIAEH